MYNLSFNKTFKGFKEKRRGHKANTKLLHEIINQGAQFRQNLKYNYVFFLCPLSKTVLYCIYFQKEILNSVKDIKRTGS